MHTTTKSKLNFLFAMLVIVTFVLAYLSLKQKVLFTLYIERINRVSTFWKGCVMKSKVFFTTVLLLKSIYQIMDTIYCLHWCA